MSDIFPHSLNLIAQASDTEAVLKIALESDGSRLWIPQKAEGSILEKIVGIDAARRIVKDLADERTDVPLAKRSLLLGSMAKAGARS